MIDGRDWRWVQRAGRRRGGGKKKAIWAETFPFGVLCKIFHVGLKERFCERGGWIRVGENCIQFFSCL